MPPLLARKRVTFLALFLACVAFYLPPTMHQLRVLGILPRPSSSASAAHLHAAADADADADADVRRIQGTTYCEDLHLHPGSGLLFTACEGEEEDRRGWFPPLGVFDRPPVRGHGGKGQLVVVDPKTFTAKTLEIRGYDDVFITHGIDIIDDPANPSAIYIHAVNHAPASPSTSSPDTSPAATTAPATAGPGPHLAASRLEIFHHTLHTPYARHIRSLSHPLIRTPNDILSLSPTSLLVTNDHKYRSGWMRHVEDVVTHSWGPKTDIIALEFDLPSSSRTPETVTETVAPGDNGAEGEGEGVRASVALDRIHNGNGLGHGPEGQVMIGDAAGGVLHLATLITSTDASTTVTPTHAPAAHLRIHTSLPVLSTIDNPSFYTSHDGRESGYVLAGLSHGAGLGPNVKDKGYKHGVVVWYIPLLDASPDGGAEGSQAGRKVGDPRLIFEDDGRGISTASAAVIVDRTSETDDAVREKWLFVTGFMSESMVAVKVEL